MSLIERMMNKGQSIPANRLELTSGSSTPEADDPAVLIRMRKVVNYISAMVPASGNAMGPIVKRIANDMLEDVREFPPELVELYIKQVAALLYWTAEGRVMDDIPLPDDFKVD